MQGWGLFQVYEEKSVVLKRKVERDRERQTRLEWINEGS